MLRYEIKKVFSKSKNRIAVIVLFVILVITSILTINKVEFVDENGNSSVGISASRDLREAKNQWAGYLTTDTLSKALEENKTINSSKEALSDDITEQNKAYAKKQGIAGIMDVIICAFSDYRDYNYYAPDHISDDEVGTIYERRISTLKNWLESGGETFSQAEKDFMIQKYEELKTPFYYEYIDGWSALLQNISTFILMLALVIGFLASGIFSDEFQSKADSIFFSARFGRSKGISAKVGAGFCITTGFYLMFVFLYTLIVLFVLGADGANCPIQLEYYFFTGISFYCCWGIYWNCICFYACNDCISTHTLYSNCDYCTIHCVMCISVFKQNYYIAGIMLVLSRPAIRSLFRY